MQPEHSVKIRILKRFDRKNAEFQCYIVRLKGHACPLVREDRDSQILKISP
jgi:hypothetical protein